MRIRGSIMIMREWLPKREDFAWFRAQEEALPGLEHYVRVVFDDALNSPTYAEWMDRINTLGLKRMPDTVAAVMNTEPERCVGYYFLESRKIFTPKECERSEYVSFFVEADMQAGCGETASGEACIDLGHVGNEVPEGAAARFLKGGLHFFSLAYNYLGVSDEGKKLLEGSDLRGFRITRPLKVMDDDAEWLDHRYWHLDIPTVVPLSPKMRWIDPDGRSYVGSWVPGAYPPDDGLIVLDRVSLEKAGFPDVAIHEEPREAGTRFIRTVGSHRWFKFCKAHKIRCNWTPVGLGD